jgi:hypothetical protein
MEPTKYFPITLQFESSMQDRVIRRLRDVSSNRSTLATSVYRHTKVNLRVTAADEPRTKLFSQT